MKTKRNIGSLNKGSYTQRTLNHVIQDIERMEKKSSYQKRARSGDFGIRASRRALTMSKEKYQSYLDKKQLRTLIKNQLIETEKQGNQIILRLTSHGETEGLKSHIVSCNDAYPEGSSCLVTFDIPEHIKKVRDMFRYFIKQAGFRQIHRSVWESDKRVALMLTKLIRSLKAEKWIKVYEAKQVTDNQ